MRSELFAIPPLALWHAGVIAAVLFAAAALWITRERRAGHLTPDAWWRALLSAALVSALLPAALLAVTHRFHDITIRSYGLMLMLAFLGGILLAVRLAPSYAIDPNDIIDWALFALLGSIIGARALYVLLHYRVFAASPADVLRVWEGGLSFHGGLAGAILVSLAFCAVKHMRPALLADLAAAPVALGYGIGRWGCFLNGCCQGHETNLPFPFGIVFPENFTGGQKPVPVHPTQVYASLGSFLILGILVRLRPRLRVPGHLGLAYVGLYSVLRFGLEFLRRTPAGALQGGPIGSASPWHLLPGLTEGQAASVAAFVVVAAAMILTRRRIGYPLPAPPEPVGAGDTANPAPGRRKPKKHRPKHARS